MEADGSLFSPLKMAWDGKRYVLTDELRYWHDGKCITVPAGFTTDLDSVPRIPFGYWLLKDRSKRPPVIHDWLYYAQMGRAYADRVFLDAMRDAGLSAAVRYPIYWAVRIGGGAAYEAHARRAA